MEILKIIDIEKENTGNINLIKEGMFWRAYELSAYLFCENIKVYKITKRFYKKANLELVYLGFPNSAIESIISEINCTIHKTEKQIVISKYGYSHSDYLAWKSDVKPKNNSGETQSLSTIYLNTIANKITSFDTLNKTPMQCQQFLVDIQKEIKNGAI